MAKIYVDLEIIAHLFHLQQIREEEHRERHYANKPELKETVRLEVKSSLFYAFGKILEVAEMSHPISEYDRSRLLDKADNKSRMFIGRQNILKDS